MSKIKTDNLVMAKQICAMRYLKECANCLVVESRRDASVEKNRDGTKCLFECIKFDFQTVKRSELDMTNRQIRKKYYNKNVWLFIDE